jgi:serine O-acetyltransferase
MTILKPGERSSLLQLIRSDLRAKAQWVYGEVTTRALLKSLVADGTFAMMVYRLMQWCQAHRLIPLAMLFNKVNSALAHCVIGREAAFGPGFVLIHSDGIVINSSVQGGADIRLEHQVTIGAERGQSPRLGDDVFVGAGARILGAVSVGNHVRIGANAVVLDDVPDNTTAVGVPARVAEKTCGSLGVPECRGKDPAAPDSGGRG